MTAKIYDFEKEKAKTEKGHNIYLGSDTFEIPGCTFTGYIESHGAIDPDGIIIIQGSVTFGDDDVQR